jgi:hypothetical protein
LFCLSKSSYDHRSIKKEEKLLGKHEGARGRKKKKKKAKTAMLTSPALPHWHALSYK